MIDIEFKGLTSKRKRLLFEEAITFFISKQINKLPPVICINIEVTKNLNASGFCLSYEPGLYVIELNLIQSFEDQLLTLAHESVHCKQYIKRELELKKGTIYWKKSPATDRDINDYFNSPWEIEAYTKEKILFSEFRNNEHYKSLIDKIVQQEFKRQIKSS